MLICHAMRMPASRALPIGLSAGCHSSRQRRGGILKDMANKRWDGERHPRGQPDNPGKFKTAHSHRAEAADIGTVLLDEREPSVGRAVLEGETVWFEYRYNPEINKKVKAVGGRFDGSRKQWWVPVDQPGLADLIENVGFSPTPELAERELKCLGGQYAGTASIDGDRVWLDYPFDRDVNEKVKACGGRFDKDQKRWWVGLGNPFADDLFGEPNFKEPPGWAEARSSRKQHREIKLDGFGVEPLKFQMDGIQHAVDNRRVIIADQPGLGKTVQALAAAYSEDAFPVIVVCPANLVTNWEREARRAYSEAKSVFKVDCQIDGPLTADVIIVSYNRLEAALPYLPPDPKAVIFDESHYLKSWKSKRTRAALQLTESMPDDSMKMILSGTPLPNKVAELAPQLEVLGKLSDFGGWKRYADRYCDPQDVQTRKGLVTTYNGATRLDELSDRLGKGTLIRRVKKDVLEDLPPKMYSVVTIDAAERLDSAYEEFEDLLTNFDFAEQGNGHGGMSVSEIVRLMAACPDLDDIPAHLVHEAREAIRHTSEIAALGGLRQITGMMKLGPSVDYIRSMLEGGDGQVVVFAHHRPIIERLASELGAGAVYGGISTAERDKLIADFQSDDPGSSRVIVLGATASAEGINLQRGSDVVMVEQPWNPGLCEQAEDRCHRIGQEGQVTIHYMLAANTIDEMVATLVEKKRKVIGQVLDSRTGAPEEAELDNDSTDEDIAALVLAWLRSNRGSDS